MASRLKKKQVLTICRLAGFRGRHLLKAGAVSGAESGWLWGPDSVYVNQNGSRDRGVFQINDLAHPYFTDEEAFAPIRNAKYAYVLSNGGKNWTPWYAFGGARYLMYYAICAASLAAEKAGLWKTSLAERVAILEKKGDDWTPDGGA